VSEPTLAGLAAALAELRERLDALEQAPRAASPRLDLADLVPALRSAVDEDGAGIVVYAGTAKRGKTEIAWQLGHRVEDVLAADRARIARSLAALASPPRLDIVARLLDGPVARQELLESLEQSTAGQLNHHLRELLAAGVVDQPARGVYQVPVHRVIPILTLLGCAIDLAGGPDEPE
jgi:DNA-binding transcriptional ArsR family regulator